MKKTDPIKKVELADGSTRYRFVVDVGKKPNGKRDQRTFTYDTYKEARNERARIINEKAVGTYVKPNKNLTVRGYFVDEWLPSKSGKKPSTVACYRNALAQFLDVYGDLALQQLDVPHLEELKRDMLSGKARRTGRLGEPMTPRSVNLMLTVVSMGLKVAHKRGLVARNVGEIVEKVPSDPDAGAGRGDWQTGDAKRFLRHVANHRLYAAFVCSALGLRRGEVCGLRWSDVDIAGDLAEERKLPKGTPSIAVVNNRVAVDGEIVEGAPKGKGRRRVPYLPIPALLVDALKTAKAQQAKEKLAAGEAYGTCPTCGAAHLVVDELGRPYRPEWYSDQFARLAAAAGVPAVVLHGARHSAASLLADMGVPDIVAAAWLGHTQIQVTQGYQHVQMKTLTKTSKQLGKLLAG